VLECFADGTLASRLGKAKVRGLTPDEGAVLALLEQRADWRRQLLEAARAA
jgi:hypothetical protein